MSIRIPVYQPYMHGREKEYVNECIESTWISSRGKFIESFESAFANYTKAEHATAVSNGTVALHLALAALGVGPGDEVIVPSLTYVASVNTIVQVGAVPVFVDSLEGTLQMDPSDVLQKVTSRTKAIMAVHLYGHPCEMDALQSICNDRKLFLIEDCAEAFGTWYKGQHAGTFGDIATFSFFGNKTVTCGEGGMVVARDQRLIERARHLKAQGVSSTKQYWHDVIAYNYRMTNVQAAIGLAQLEQADEILSKKSAIAKLYSRKLQDLPLYTHEADEKNIVHSYWMCSAILNDASLRDPLREALAERGVETRPFFYPSHFLPMYDNSYEVHPVAEKLSASGLNLPSWPGLAEEQVCEICSIIRSFFKMV
ncbi:DegT/DnrJ/EryC1/StrS family aminotransferase [Halodesulfovibrio aestuarii]|uniref:DegT/DnrJ/EryC1/StrS family aminotransferase n=1 Tax=Halodesulfovibrio aestuarii TaxID=126333 RepID=UPI003D3404AF